MIKGVIIAIGLLLAGDMTLNQGKISHVVWDKLTGFASASRHAVGDSVFRR